MMRVRIALALLSTMALASCSALYLDFDTPTPPTTTTGTAGAGGAGGAPLCMPGATKLCYGGPTGTEGVGICKAGKQTCDADGASWGMCVGEVRPATENCATPQDDDCDGFSPECTGTHVWSRRFGDMKYQLGNALAVDKDDNILIAGQFAGTLDFGGGVSITSGTGGDAFVAKLDPTGVVTWARGFTGPGAGRVAQAVSVDGVGNVVICGEFFGGVDLGDGKGPIASAGLSDIFVIKLDPMGQVLWGTHFGGAGSDGAPSVAVGVGGDIVLTGNTNADIDFGGGPLPAAGGTDLYVAKLDTDGQHVWSKRLGDASAQAGRAVAVGAAGEIVLAGQAAGVIDFGCGPLSDAGGGDIVIAKLDAAGQCAWSKRYGDAGTQDAAALAVADDGSVVLVGNILGSIDLGTGPLTSAGGKDLLVAKIDGAGGTVWARRFGDGHDQVGRAVTLDGAGNVVTTGYFGGSIDFGGNPLMSTDFYDVFLAKLDQATGDHLWSKRFGDALEQQGAGVATDSAENTLLTGTFFGTIDFGGNTLKSAGGADLFVAKLSE